MISRDSRRWPNRTGGAAAVRVVSRENTTTTLHASRLAFLQSGVTNDHGLRLLQACEGSMARLRSAWRP